MPTPLDARHEPPPDAAICVLGCRPGGGALARRARAARGAFLARGATLVVACGGVCWQGRVEAEELARMLQDGGIPREAIVCERASRNTRENARFAAAILAARGVRDVVVVTCSWHLRRATRLFEQAGLRVVAGVGAPPPNPSLAKRVWWAAREQLSTWKEAWV